MHYQFGFLLLLLWFVLSAGLLLLRQHGELVYSLGTWVNLMQVKRNPVGTAEDDQPRDAMRVDKLVTTYFKYIFYRAYLWQGKIQANENRRILTALAYVSVLLVLYLLMLMAISDDLFKTALLSLNKRGAIIFAVIVTLLFYVIPHVMLLRGGGYKKIIAEMSSRHETKSQERFRAFLIFMNYIVLFILTTVLAVLPNLIR